MQENAKLLCRRGCVCRCFIQRLNRGQTVGVDARLNECMALYLCVSSHVHVCGAYICLPEASVLNSLSMCDESSGWEKEQRVSWPLSASHTLNSKGAIDLSRSQFQFCSAPISHYLIYMALYPPFCIFHCVRLCIFFFISCPRFE